MKKNIVKIEPILKEKIWGGNVLKSWFPQSEHNDNIGEAWIVVAKTNESNEISHKKGTLFNYLTEYSDEFPMKTLELPFRITIIDAKEQLSIQVHPTTEYAHAKGLPSSLDEAWIILNSDIETKIQIGHNASNFDELEKMIMKSKWDKLLKYRSVKKGETYFIKAGVMHALGSNSLVFEISQALDVTYRVYDYNRIDTSTNTTRELHVKEALENITINQTDIQPIINPIINNESYMYTQKIRCQYFSVDEYNISGTSEIVVENWGFLTIISGSGSINGIAVNLGETLLIPLSSRKLNCSGNFVFFFSFT